MGELQVKRQRYVVGVEWGADRTLVAAEEGATPTDRGFDPKVFESIEAARVEISARRLLGMNLKMFILRFGADETQWSAWLDHKDTWIEKY